MHKLSVISFFLVLCSQFGMAQAISEEELMGKWLVKSVDIANDNPKHETAVRFIKEGFTDAIFYFRGNGIFNMRFPKTADSRIEQMNFSGENWRVNNDVIEIGTADQGYNTMHIVVQKMDGTTYFDLPMMRLEVEKIKSEKPKKHREGASSFSMNIERQYKNQLPIERYQKDLSQDEIVPFALVELPPIAKGCDEDLNPEELKKCTSNKIMQHVQRKFDIELAVDLGLSGRIKIVVLFIIDTEGQIINLSATGDYQTLNENAMNTVASFPKFKPAKKNGQAVHVEYRLPIIFQIQN